MVSCDLVIRGGDVVLPSRGLTTCDIAIKDGRFAALLAPGVACSAKEEVSANGLVVFPGAVDAHLHLGHGRISVGDRPRLQRRPRSKPAVTPPGDSAVGFLQLLLRV